MATVRHVRAFDPMLSVISVEICDVAGSEYALLRFTGSGHRQAVRVIPHEVVARMSDRALAALAEFEFERRAPQLPHAGEEDRGGDG